MLNLSPDRVLWDMSYDNLILYTKATPSHESSNKEEEWDDRLDANNPNNFSLQGDEEKVYR